MLYIDNYAYLVASTASNDKLEDCTVITTGFTGVEVDSGCPVRQKQINVSLVSNYSTALLESLDCFHKMYIPGIKLSNTRKQNNFEKICKSFLT